MYRRMLVVAVLLLLAACRQQAPPLAAPPPGAGVVEDLPGLARVLAIDERVLVGAAPDERGFATLAALGVRTVISVDGAVPDLAAAARQGLAYIHLPIGYDGASAERQRQLAAACAGGGDLIYLHCHHGRHRAPAAAVCALRQLDRMDADTARRRLREAGTADAYPGLHALADTLALDGAAIASLPADLPRSVQPIGLAAIMSALDDAVGHLRLSDAADWTQVQGHPDLAPAAEAGRLVDLVRSMAGPAEGRPVGFEAARQHQLDRVRQLEQALLDKAPSIRLREHLAAVRAGCTACHRRYRDRSLPAGAAADQAAVDPTGK